MHGGYGYVINCRLGPEQNSFVTAAPLSYCQQKSYTWLTLIDGVAKRITSSRKPGILGRRA